MNRASRAYWNTAVTPHQKLARVSALQAQADREDRPLWRHEETEIDRLLEELETVSNRRTSFDNIATSRSQRSTFANLGQFAALVKTACNPEGGQRAFSARARLLNAAPTTSTEGIGPDGGFAVPPEFRAEILRKVATEEDLIQRCDIVPTAGSSLSVPKDETPPWGSGGIRAYWDGEAHQYTQSKAALESSTIKSHKLTALVPVTDELLEDAPALTKYLLTRGSDAIRWKTTDAIVNGTGAGMPLGIMNSPCLVTFSKESSQAAGTIVAENVLKMFSRVYAPWRRDAVWLAHSDAQPQIMQLHVKIKNVAGTENVGGMPIYVPAGTIEGQPQDTLLGRPIIYTQSAQALGTKGDLILAGLSQYAATQRGDGIRTDSSIHLFFDYGVTAFRFTFRMGGQPWWSAPLTPKNGSNTLSPFVTLETRS